MSDSSQPHEPQHTRPPYWLTIREGKDFVSSQHFTQTCSFPSPSLELLFHGNISLKARSTQGSQSHWEKAKVLLSCLCDSLLQGESEACYQGQTSHVPLSFLYLTLLLVTNSKFIREGARLTVQFGHSVMSGSLRPHELQHARPPCPSPTHYYGCQ